MKFNVSSTTLSAALQDICKVIPSKSTLPVLDCFLFDLQDEKVILTASDSETVLQTEIEVSSVEGSGQFAIEAKRFLDTLKELPEQPLSIEINEDMTANITYQNGNFSAPYQSGDAYPQHKAISETAVSITLESSVLLSGINRTLPAAGDDELRPVMNGVFFDIKAESMTFVASDGHKLVRLRDTSIKSEQEASFILPRKPANILKGLLKKNAEPIVIIFDQNNAMFKTPSFEMVCRLIEGRYPNYESVIPKENPYHAKIDSVSFKTAVSRVSKSGQADGLVKLDFTEDSLLISAQDIDFSTSAEERIVCQYSSTPLQIGFKSAHMIDFMSIISSTNFIFQLADPTRAGVIVPAEPEENEDLVMLAMPLMLNN